jgi:hypothetical protein
VKVLNCCDRSSLILKNIVTLSLQKLVEDSEYHYNSSKQICLCWLVDDRHSAFVGDCLFHILTTPTPYYTPIIIRIIIDFHQVPDFGPTSASPPSSPSSLQPASLVLQSCYPVSFSHPPRRLPKLNNNQLISANRASSNILGLSDLEYSFNFPTKSSKSCCLPSLFSKLRFCNSGLYFRKISSSVGEM